jgi:hypothetical protein
VQWFSFRVFLQKNIIAMNKFCGIDRKLILTFLILSVSTIAYSQAFKLGTNVFSAGLGIGGSFGNYNYSSQSPAIGVAYEFGLRDDVGPGIIGLGGYAGHKSFAFAGRDSYNGLLYNENRSYSLLGMRAAYHYDFHGINELDVYGGAFVGFSILNFKSHYPNGNQGPFTNSFVKINLIPALYVGGRYYFTETLGAFAELGYGISYLTVGGQYRF